MLTGGFLIDADAETVLPAVNIDAGIQRTGIDSPGPVIRQMIANGIKPGLVGSLKAQRFESFHQQACQGYAKSLSVQMERYSRSGWRLPVVPEYQHGQATVQPDYQRLRLATCR